MRYKRNELFRYTFEEPISARFQIGEIDGRKTTTSEGEATIINISQEGLKLNTKLNIPETERRAILLLISFKLNEEEFHVQGRIVWKKEHYDKVDYVDYGIDLIMDDDKKEKLVKQLKLYVKTNK
ncbi:PilZ domain-containing protein [Virgibacillus sp. W0181]|uniref:PilZ domain-containing protein n=1 Tax=Virgibacillus sp. W0181 TaxID=3391581 RepID=UPI003F44565D